MASPVSSMDELLLITFSLQSCPTSQTPKPGVSHTRLTERGSATASSTHVLIRLDKNIHMVRLLQQCSVSLLYGIPLALQSQRLILTAKPGVQLWRDQPGSPVNVLSRRGM